MFNSKQSLGALFLCLLCSLLITACGGGGGSSQPTLTASVAPPLPPVVSTGNAYLPATAGTHISYYECVINGTFNPQTLDVTLPPGEETCTPASPNYSGTYAVSYSAQTCSPLYPQSQQFLSVSWFIGANPPPNYYKYSLLGGSLTHWNGYTVTSGPGTGSTISGLGDGFGNYGALNIPELSLTDNPVVGQHIRAQSLYASSCAATTPSPVNGATSNDWEQNTIAIGADTVDTSIHEYSWSVTFRSTYQKGVGPVKSWWASDTSAPMDTSKDRPNYHGPAGNGYLYVMFEQTVDASN